MQNAKKILGNQISYAADIYSAAQNADVLAILTEWPEFKELNLAYPASLMHQKNIVDCRNILNRKEVIDKGFNYRCIGYNNQFNRDL